MRGRIRREPTLNSSSNVSHTTMQMAMVVRLMVVTTWGCYLVKSARVVARSILIEIATQLLCSALSR